jgi:hypothetical protein
MNRRANGGRLAPHPEGPERRTPPIRPFTCPTEHEESRNGGRAVLENVPPELRVCLGTFSRGAPSGIAFRRSASRPPRRPSRRPAVAVIDRGRRTLHATAGRRAGAEARRAPNATAGRCIEEPGPVPMLPNDVLRSARGGCQAPLKECRTTMNRRANGGRLAPHPEGPERRTPPIRPFTCPTEHEESRNGGRAGDS